MCGLTGFWQPNSFDGAFAEATALQMANTLLHRGPDDGGVWSDEVSGIALAHRRLSILDLSPAGHQPMVGATGRYVLAFNGEIYNHLELRDELKKLGAGVAQELSWRGHSDTETLLAGFSAWGIRATVERCIGMFAFAVWDREKHALILGRDRFGEKPLYYGWVGRGFAFASELKALRAVPGFDNPVDRGALALYLRHNYVPAPYSIYQGIYKLPAGHWLELTVSYLTSRQIPPPQPYWSAQTSAQQGVKNQLTFSGDVDATDALERVLQESIRGQMVADVPLGAFLSGGVDSSAVVALMQAEAKRTGSGSVKTFSIGFDDPAYDEAPYAKAVAKHLGTEHTELYVQPSDSLAVIPRLPEIFDEPFADSSQIPTFLVAQMTRQHVTVALSGDAGDELFCGYNRYFLAARLWDKLSYIPHPVRAAAGQLASSIPVKWWNSVYGPVSGLLPMKYRVANAGDKIHKAARVLADPSANKLYMSLVSHWDPSSVLLEAREPVTQLTLPWPELPTLMEQMMLLDTVSYLPDDILTKVDRAAMAVSLETRVPFLDHRVFEFAWRLPMHYKVRDGQGKWLLRQVLYRHVPKALIERPKMGFGIPLDAWLRGPLREWAEELIDPIRLRQEGFFDAQVVRRTWDEHQSGKRNWAYHLWDILMFQAWLDNA